MIVVLQNHLTTKPEALPIVPCEENFAKALEGMGLDKNVIDNFVVIIEVRRMLPKGIYGGRNKNVFRVIIDDHISFSDRGELNKTIAHELKHLAIAVLKPHPIENSTCADGFYFGKYKHKSEELDCKLAEDRWDLEFFKYN